MSQNSNKCTIYALVDPRTESVRYVGATFSIRQRYAAHCCPPANFCTYEWVQELKAEGLKPRMEILEVCPDKWQDREQYWMDFHKENSDLLNQTDHAGGGRPALKGYKMYKVYLPIWLAEWAKTQPGGLSGTLRRAFEESVDELMKQEEKYRCALTSQGSTLREPGTPSPDAEPPTPD